MARTLAERLGFAARDRVAIVHADDIGMCHAANEGAFEALEKGSVTCGSLMVPCPWFAEAAERARANPGLDLGVHLTLTAEWQGMRWAPLTGRKGSPSLLDTEGYLPRTIGEVAAHAEPSEIAAELHAQVEAALEAGIDVTHLDTHMGVCFLPQVVGIYKDLALEFQLPVFAAWADEAAVEANGLPAAAAEVIRRGVEALEAGGVPILDGFDAASLVFGEGEGRAHNEARLAGLPEGVSYLICHPARDGEELRAITPDGAHQRDYERQLYGGAEGAKLLAAQGIRTTGMRALRELMRAAPS